VNPQHVNIVELCSQDYGKYPKALEWVIRFKMAIGVVQGLHYLHEICHRCIIHRNVNASNILLGPDFEPHVEHKNWMDFLYLHR
jgi:serine/threonine protein kinase